MNRGELECHNIIASEASSLVKSMATLSIYISRTYERTCVLVPGGTPHNVQKSGRLVKDQRSLKSPRKWLICYLTLRCKIAAIAMDKELNTRQDVLLDVQNSS